MFFWVAAEGRSLQLPSVLGTSFLLPPLIYLPCVPWQLYFSSNSNCVFSLPKILCFSFPFNLNAQLPEELTQGLFQTFSWLPWLMYSLDISCFFFLLILSFPDLSQSYFIVNSFLCDLQTLYTYIHQTPLWVSANGSVFHTAPLPIRLIWSGSYNVQEVPWPQNMKCN